jgi:hypothetical protein
VPWTLALENLRDGDGTVALERLGSGELYVRIGGVHALEHVMHDSAGHHDDVIEVLTEFIRDCAPRCANPSDHQVWMHPVTGSVPDPLPSEPTPDVQAALTALGHRPHRPERQTIDLIGLHLAGARLADANLTGANLTGAQLGDADLTAARLVRADLTGAWLVGTNLTHAALTDPHLAGAWLFCARLGANPSVVPFGWVITDSLTGELRPVGRRRPHLRRPRLRRRQVLRWHGLLRRGQVLRRERRLRRRRVLRREVDFGGAEFSGGTVDFSQARDWSHPPVFGPGFDEASPPPGITLPTVAGPSPDTPAPAT